MQRGKIAECIALAVVISENPSHIQTVVLSYVRFKSDVRLPFISNDREETPGKT